MASVTISKQLYPEVHYMQSCCSEQCRSIMQDSPVYNWECWSFLLSILIFHIFSNVTAELLQDLRFAITLPYPGQLYTRNLADNAVKCRNWMINTGTYNYNSSSNFGGTTKGGNFLHSILGIKPRDLMFVNIYSKTSLDERF